MFPARLPSLPDINAVAHKSTITQLLTIGGGIGDGGGGGIFSGNGPSIGMPPIIIGGGSGGGGTTTPVGFSLGGALSGGLSSVLGIPAINWGRIAAFLLGLLLIAGGIFLIRPAQRIVINTVKAASKASEIAAA